MQPMHLDNTAGQPGKHHSPVRTDTQQQEGVNSPMLIDEHHCPVRPGPKSRGGEQPTHLDEHHCSAILVGT